MGDRISKEARTKKQTSEVTQEDEPDEQDETEEHDDNPAFLSIRTMGSKEASKLTRGISRGVSAFDITLAQTDIQNAQSLLRSIEEHHDNSANAFDLVASNSFCSKEVRKVMGSTIMNSYCIGLPGSRFYGGCDKIDDIELQTRQVLCDLFGAKYCEVQLLSGSKSCYEGWLRSM